MHQPIHFDFIKSVLSFDLPIGLTEEQIKEREMFVLRLQQFTVQ